MDDGENDIIIFWVIAPLILIKISFTRYTSVECKCSELWGS